MFSQRIPKGKASVLIFLMVVIEQFVFYGAVSEVLELIPELNNLQGSELRYLLQPFLLFCVGRLFYPVGGYLADVYFGRYRVIHISLWLYWVAFVLLTIANTIYILNKGENIVHDYIIPLISYSCIILASGGFQSTIIPFGADQLEAASSSELSSYFYWYYLGIQISAPLNVIIFSLLTLYLPSKLGIAQSLISLVVVTVGLILHITLKNWYFRNALRENCIKIVTQVTCFAAIVRRQVPQYHRAFRYGEDKLPRIELAKREYDGKFTRDQVEDVKTFCRICLILFTFGGYLLSMNGGYVMLSYRLNQTLSLSTNNHNLQTILFPNAYPLLNALSVSLTIPLVNHFLLPCVPSMTMRERMGIGMVITITGLASAAYVEWAIAELTPLHQAMWFILPSVLLSVQEVFTAVTILEFIYAQSPESIKGMLIGLFYFTEGIYSGAMSAIFFEISKYSDLYTFYYIVLLVFTVLSFTAYLIVACLYVNHLRPLSESDTESNIRQLYNHIVF